MTKLFAVTGNPILFSLSPKIFLEAAKIAKVNAAYFCLSADSAQQALALACEVEIDGMCVTAPYKEQMMMFMDEHDHSAKQVKALNTIVFKKNKKFGYNTDPFGICEMFRFANTNFENKKVVIIGAGGASRAILVALKNYAVPQITVINRDTIKGEKLAKEFDCKFFSLAQSFVVLKNADIVISTLPKQAKGFRTDWVLKKHEIFDASYGLSQIGSAANKADCKYMDGRRWLIGQGAKGFEIFTKQKANMEAMYIATASSANSTLSKPIVIVGMPGVGKSTVAFKLSKILNKKFIDTDVEIEKNQGKNIEQIFATNGELAFRNIENIQIKHALKNTDSVIAIGGGALENKETMLLLRNNAVVIWLWAGVSILKKRINNNVRPLLNVDNVEKKLQQLLKNRKNNYALAANLLMDTSLQSQNIIAKRIANEIASTIAG